MPQKAVPGQASEWPLCASASLLKTKHDTPSMELAAKSDNLLNVEILAQCTSNNTVHNAEVPIDRIEH